MKMKQVWVAALLTGCLAMMPGLDGASAQSRPAPAAADMKPSATLGPAPRPAPANAEPVVPRRASIPGMARFRSIGTDDTVMFDAPSDKAKRIYQAPKGMPVEVVSVLQSWVKVRDMQGDVAWVHRDDLADRRTVIATTQLPLLKEPGEMAGRWFEAAPGVVFDLQDERIGSDGFVRVRHADGQTGFIDSSMVWGL
ncbi:MAG: SH3 domain-containing protein [Lautropia sp.]|nr:SH3 domain-containing protein [Lautropia sp.]